MTFDPKSLYRGDGSDLVTPEGVFWADHIKTLRDQPEARLLFAEEYQPLPAAFREAAIALRALIRERRRDKQPYDELLQHLYRTAARHAFLFNQPQVAGSPAFNAVAQLERDEWTSLEMSYARIGYEKLPLLGKTDRKWIVEAWGEPAQHRNPQEVHKEVFQRGIDRFQEDQRRSEARFRSLMRSATVDTSARQGCLSLLLAAVPLKPWLGHFG